MSHATERGDLEEGRQRHKVATVALLMNDHYLRYLQRLYKAFDGDVVAAIVLGEVAHHNLSVLRQGLTPRQIAARLADPGFRDSLVPTNAFSIAQATGIPRETVRRKIAYLVKRDLLLQDARANLVVSPATATTFTTFNLSLLQDHLDVADRLRDFLDAPS